jgi:general secretion pathway protein D
VATNAAAAAQPEAAAVPAKQQPPALVPTTASGNAQLIPQPASPDAASPDKALPAADAPPATPMVTPNLAAENSASPPPLPANSGTNGLRLNFRNAPLDRVLNYMSEAAGFIIVLEAKPRGTVDVWSNSPVTKEEAINLLNQALKKNDYAAIRNGRTLTIVPRDEAKTHDIPVYVGADPAAIPKTDEIVTQIIPVRFVEVAQLVKDIQPLISTKTTMTANESGNEIVITDTQANIRKVAEVIKAIDAGAEDITVVRVFRLNYADPTELSELLVNLFPDDSRSGGSSSPVQFGGMRSFFRGGGPGGGGGGGGGSNNQNSRIKKRARVVAVPDPRTSSLVVTSSRDLMDQIESVVVELDSNPARQQKVHIYKFDNADPQQAMQVLQDMFQKSGAQTSRNNQNSVLQQRSGQQSSSQGTSSSRTGGGSRGGASGMGSFGQ